MRIHSHECCFYSDIYRAKEAVLEILTFIAGQLPLLTEEEKNDLRLIFSELLYNAVIHGNGRDTSKRVRVRVRLRTDAAGATISAWVVDEGHGFDYQDQGADQGQEPEFISESGRGIQLVRGIVDTFSLEPPGNKVEFSKKVRVAVNG